MQNLHTHTVLSDAKNTPSEMAAAAVELGFSSLGFSDHAPMQVPNTWGMQEEKVPDYLAEIRRIKQAFAGKLEIFAGMELDSTSPGLPYPFDYTIGSMHYFYTEGKYYEVDHREEFMEALRLGFHGDIHALQANYFERVCDFALENSYPIQGHFDLVTIWCDHNPVFDTEDPVYQRLALEALHAVVEAGKIIEVNTGAMSRGYKVSPYPQRFLLEECCRMHAPILLSSDCHQTTTIGYAFSTVRELLVEIGFKTQCVLTSHGWDEEAL